MTMRTLVLRALVALLAAAMLPGSASAWDSIDGQGHFVTTGNVLFVEGADETGFDFQLVGSPLLCDGAIGRYGVVKSAYGASETRVKLMLGLTVAAKLSGTQMTVLTTTSPGGDCSIYDLIVR